MKGVYLNFIWWVLKHLLLISVGIYTSFDKAIAVNVHTSMDILVHQNNYLLFLKYRLNATSRMLITTPVTATEHIATYRDIEMCAFLITMVLESTGALPPETQDNFPVHVCMFIVHGSQMYLNI